MMTKPLSWLTMLSLTLTFLACGANAAETNPAGKEQKAGTASMADLVCALSKFPLPPLSGLLSPEKCGILSGNECSIRDNQANLLSGNEMEVETLSNNEVRILSAIRLLSNLSLNVHIHFEGNSVQSPDSRAKKGAGKKALKPEKRKKPPKAKSR